MHADNMNEHAQIGVPVRDFSFEAYCREAVETMRLADFRGQWLVVFFYPADFTFVCPTELEELADFYAEFKKLGAEIISVSTDTVYAHKAWHDTSPAIMKINFPMAADPAGKLARYFGTYIEDEGISLRGTFVIDPEGILRAMEVNDNSIGRSSGELLRKLQAAKFVAEHKGLVCPASWHPGDKALETGRCT